MTAEATQCEVCGFAAAEDVCTECALAGNLVRGSAEERLGALQGADKYAVLMAFVRGAHLWDGVSSGEVDLGKALVSWLVANTKDLAFCRFISEDARYGHLAMERLCAEDDYNQTLCRIPVWLARSGKAAEHVIAKHLKVRRCAALGFRLGATRVDPETSSRLVAQAPWLGRGMFRQGLEAGAQNPGSAWVPSSDYIERAHDMRRWPFIGVEKDAVTHCIQCGEGARRDAPCPRCGGHWPDDLVLASPEEILDERTECAHCRIDKSAWAERAVCPLGCM